MLLSLFENILGMSVIGSYIIGVVFLVRLLLLKCGRKYAYFLWVVVFINLCLPITINAPFSLIPQKVVSVAEELTGSKKQAVAATDADEVHLAYLENLENLGMASEELTLPMKDGQQNVQGTSPVDETTVNITNGNEQAELKKGNITEVATAQKGARIILSKVSVVEILSLVWILGMVAVGGYGAVQMLRLNKQIKALKECFCEDAGVVCMEGIESPFLWGLLHPTIYLPASIEASEREYIIAHERFHKKRGDQIMKLLVLVVVAIHWFNPVVWAAYVFFIRDMEISCDEAVLSHAEKNINKQYAGSLLKYAAKQNGFVLSPITFGEPLLKSRIRNVLTFKKRGMAVTIIAICVVELTACGLVLKPQPEEGTVTESGDEQQTGEQTPTYKLTAVAQEDYNAVFECNGYQYWFKLDIDTTNLSLMLGKDVEKSNATGKWAVTPVYAVDGEHGVLLGDLRGLTFDVYPETYVEHPYVPGERVYGIIGEVTENRVTVQPVEVIDMDTYQEYRMDAAMEPVTYELAKNVEYIMFDPNFLGVNTTFERFTEHVNNNADMVWCLVLVDGEVVEIYEPYMP